MELEEQIEISIHAPREGSDMPAAMSSMVMSPFQSTLPVRGATMRPDSGTTLSTFQSTLPVRGATLRSTLSPPAGAEFQSTLPVRGATCELGAVVAGDGHISIHAPREGSDAIERIAEAASSIFQSTLPVRGATAARPERPAADNISIHAPREGSDEQTLPARMSRRYFNPRSP